MSNQTFQNKLIGGIGRVHLSAKVGNPFPFVGDEVTLQAVTRWAQRVVFTKKAGLSGADVTETINNTSQATETKLTVSSEGELMQQVRAMNFDNDGVTELFSDNKVRYLYVMQRQNLPYHEVSVSSEISRINQDFSIRIASDNGYDLSREHTLEVFVLKENGSSGNPADVMAHRTQTDFTLVDGILTSTDINIPIRGIYDVETRYSDTATGKTIRKRVNKLISITPRLAARPSEGQQPFSSINSGTAGVKIDMYKTGTNDLYMVFDIPNIGYYDEINITPIPSGYDAYTLVLKKPYAEDDNVMSRIRLTCDVINGNPSQSPTPQFTDEHPLVITIDQNTPLDLHGTSYNTLNIAGLRNIVVDGRGYYNLEKGLKFSANPVTGDTPTIAVQFSNGSRDLQLFELEISGTGFTAIMAKTDPNGTNPWWWYGNFDQKNFHLHHLHIHDTSGEGCYLGYFTPGQENVTYTGENVTFKNLSGENVTYEKGKTYGKKAHYLSNFRFYRNLIERTGYDGAQISNSVGEVCYNTLIGCAHKEESSQTSGLSIQSFTGKCYNNLVYECHGSSLQIGPIGDMDIYNNVVYSSLGSSIQFLFSYDVPEQNPTLGEYGIINEVIQLKIHNNVIATPGMTANGRNTVQVLGLHLYDNIIVNNGVLFGNMTEATIERWTTQCLNNAIFKYAEFYDKAAEYKIADYDNGDFRIAFDSPLIDGGLGSDFAFDYRGYLNWYNGNYPIGPFMGKYINPSIVTVPLELLSVMVNAGTTETDNKDVSVEYTCKGKATHYRIGQTSDLTDAEWLPIVDSPLSYNLQGEYGEKTIYLQLKNSAENSAVLNDKISYVAPPYILLTLNSISINEGSASTFNQEVGVKMNYTEADTTAAGYRVSESMAALVDMPFSNIVNPFTFQLSAEYGSKTIYVQVKDSDGNITDAVAATIEYMSTPQEKMAMSLSWPGNETGYDEIDGVNKVAYNNSALRKLYSNIGTVFCNTYRTILTGTASYKDTTAGAITGDNSFDYPDRYMNRNMLIDGNSSKNVVVLFSEIPAGKYRVRIFASSIATNVSDIRSFFRAYTGYETSTQVIYEFAKPSSIRDNKSEWMVREVDIPEDGLLAIEYGMIAGSKFEITAINIIDLTKVVPITSLSIAIDKRVGNDIHLKGTYQPADCTETDLEWSIDPPTINASINTAGIVTIKSTATEEEIINVKAVSPYNRELTKTIQVAIKYVTE